MAGPGITDPWNPMFDPKLAGPGTHTITYSITDGNGCSDIGTVDITVLEAPKANIAQGSLSNLCPGVLLELDGNPSGGIAPYTHQWTGQTAPLSSTSIPNPDFTTTNLGAFELVYRVEDSNTCWSSDTIIVDVEEVNITFNANNVEICSGTNVTLDPQPSGGSETFIFHQWTGTGTDKLTTTNTQTPIFIADEAGTFEFEYTVRDTYGCEDNETITIVVHEQPTADAGSDIITCGLKTPLGATPSVGDSNWKVISGAGNITLDSYTSAVPNAVADTYGNYHLRWIENNNNCKDSIDIDITLVEIPLPSVMDDKDTCGLSIQLIANKHIGTGQWIKTEGLGNVSFADDSKDITSVTVDTPGTYKFSWQEDNGNGCTGSDTVTINFFSLPVAQVTPPPAIGCTPQEISFINTSINADNYYWDFGNGNISNEENPQQIFTNKTPNLVDYDITLIARTNNGCADTVINTISVAPAPISYFDADIKVGCHPLVSNFTNKSQGGTDYEWTFGDGSSTATTEHTSHTFNNIENYTQSFEVKLVTKNSYSCTDTSSLFTTVYPKQEFNLIATPDSGCSPLNSSFLADPGALKYEWDMGDSKKIPGSNSNAKLFTNTTENKQKETITVYTTSFYGCLDTSEVVITVLPSPTAYFEPNDFAICSPKDVLFENKSSNAIQSFWDFGDGNTLLTTNTNDVNYTYTNSSFTPINYKIKLVAENSFGCKDSIDGFTSVNPAVNAAIDGAITDCVPFEATFGNSSTGANSYFWDYGDGNTSSGVIGQNLFDNDTDNEKTYKIKMIASSAYGCSDTATVEVKALPSPETYFIPNDFSVCSPKKVTFTNSTENIVSSIWQFGDGESTTTMGNENVEHTYINNDFTPKNFKVKLITENSFGCKDSMDGYTSVNPAVTAAITGEVTDCVPFKATFGNSSTGANNYSWDYGDGNTSSGVIGQNLFNNDTDNEKTYEVKMIASSAYGCSDTATVEVKALPSPEANFIPNDLSVCSPKKVTFTNSTENIVSSIWKFGDGESTTTIDNENVEHTYINNEFAPKNFKVKLITENSFGCKDSMDGFTSVNPSVNAAIDGEITNCVPFEATFGNSSTGANSYFWDYGDGNTSSGVIGQNIFDNNTDNEKTYLVKMIASSAYGCTDTASVEVKALPSPETYFIPNDFSVCSPKKVTFTNSTENIVSSIWKFGDGESTTTIGNENVEHTYINNEFAPKNFKVKLITENSFGCKDSMDGFTSVNPAVNAAITGEITNCVPFEATFGNSSTGANSYFWDYGDGNTSSGVIGQNLFDNNTDNEKTYEVKMIASSAYGCSDTAKVEVKALPSPETYFIPNDFSVCSPKMVTFTNSTENIVSSVWKFGDGESKTTIGSESVEHTYINNEFAPKNFKVKLITENSFGCKDSMDGFTSVNPAVNAAITGEITDCVPFEATFGNSSTGANSYSWDYGDGNTSSGIAGQNVFNNDTDNEKTYEVKMIASSAYGCSDTATVEVKALPSPETYFVPNDFSVCSPKKVTFTNYTENIINSVWNFGDGTLTTIQGNMSVDHVFYNDKYTPKEFRIRLTTENKFGCKDSMDGFTTVNPNVLAKISDGKEGCSPLEVNFSNESAGANSFKWSYGDGSTSSSYIGLNTFENNSDEDKEFDVRMIATSLYGCSDTAHTKVKVYATPKVDFSLSPDYLQMPNSTISVNNLTKGDNWKYIWDFGDTNSSIEKQPQSYTYADFGNYEISLKAYTDKCENTLTKELEIIAGIPVVDYGPSAQGCPGLKVEFYSTATNAESFIWEFGDDNISTDPNPTHTYYTEGTYTVKLTVTGPGGQTIKDDIEIKVYPEPTALFDLFPNKVTIPGESVAFANKSIGGQSYLWDFGNGKTSTETNPIYEYTNTGSYDITLDVENEYGCTSSYLQREAVIAEEGGEITFPNAFTPNPAGPSDGTYRQNDNNNYVFHPAVQEGIVEYKLQIFSRWGQILFESNDLKVGWNGYYRNKLCTQGVYIWKVTCRFSTGQTKVFTGDVTLLR